MNTIVIYESCTGFTEQYARWLAQELECPCKPLKRVDRAELAHYDRVIFGGWIMGNMICGLNKLKTMAKPAAVFAVGSTPAFDEVVSAIGDQNQLDGAPMFYMQGGFHFNQLGFVKKAILKAIKKSTAKQENRTRQGDFMADALGTSFDHSDPAQLAPLLTCLQEAVS